MKRNITVLDAGIRKIDLTLTKDGKAVYFERF